MAELGEANIGGRMVPAWLLNLTAEELDSLKSRWYSNPNLLDNWYFCNPVDQRGGYVVPPGVPSYRDSALTKSAGDTTGYRLVIATTSTYIAYTGSDGRTYYCAPGTAIRGYTGAGYGIDRWKSTNSNLAVNLTGDGITLISGSAAGYFFQYLDGGITIEDSYTISTLVEAITGTVYFQAIYSDGTYGNAVKLAVGLNVLTVKATKTISRVLFQVNRDSSVTVKSAKLELGSQQTFAHQDADGNWVLNEIPDYGEQLRRCQRYFWRSWTGERNIQNSILGVVFGNNNRITGFDYPVEMRTRPSITVYGLTGVDKVTFWDNDNDYGPASPAYWDTQRCMSLACDGAGLSNNDMVYYFIEANAEL